MKYYKVEARIEFTIAVPDYADETTLIDFVDSTESWIDPDSIMLTQIDHDVWASQADDWRQTAKFDRNGQLEWRNEPDTVHDGGDDE
jgi:hypothetical protein